MSFDNWESEQSPSGSIFIGDFEHDTVSIAIISIRVFFISKCFKV